MRVTASIKKLDLMRSEIKIFTNNKVFTLYALDHNKKSKWVVSLNFIVRVYSSENTFKRAVSWMGSSQPYGNFAQSSDFDNYDSENEGNCKRRFTNTQQLEDMVSSPIVPRKGRKWIEEDKVQDPMSIGLFHSNFDGSETDNFSCNDFE
jgi:hypothetical protein